MISRWYQRWACRVGASVKWSTGMFRRFFCRRCSVSETGGAKSTKCGLNPIKVNGSPRIDKGSPSFNDTQWYGYQIKVVENLQTANIFCLHLLPIRVHQKAMAGPEAFAASRGNPFKWNWESDSYVDIICQLVIHLAESKTRAHTWITRAGTTLVPLSNSTNRNWLQMNN